MAKLVLIGMLFGGTHAFANVSSGGDALESKLVQIQARAAKLQGEFPSVNLRVREDITSEEIANKTLEDLRDLDVVLHNDRLAPARILINLACSRAYCEQD